jgi:hypothetical protein
MSGTVTVLRVGLHQLVQVFAGKRFEQVGHDDVLLGVVPKREFRIDAVYVAPSYLAPFDVPSGFKIGYNLVGSAFSNSDILRNFSRRTRIIMGNVTEHQSMVRDEGPSCSVNQLLRAPISG